jgi:soluble cytochrome b562
VRVEDEQPTLEEIADELYGLVPDEFIPARDDHVKAARAAGDRAFAKDVTGLRKPSTAAWVVNLLVRRATDQLVALLDLGESLRTAQSALAGDQLKELSRQRAQVVYAIAREGRRLAREAGHPVSPAIEEEVAETLRAALADPVAAQAVRTGRLTSSLSYAGLGELDVSGVVALAPRRAARAVQAPEPDGAGEDPADDAPARRPRARVRAVPDADDAPAEDRDAARRRREEEQRRAEEERRREEEARRRAELEDARRTVADAEDALDTARVTQRLAQDAFDEAREAADRAQARVAELEEALRRAQDAAGEATAAVRPRRREHETARHGVDVATRALDRARAHLERLDR